LEPSSILLVPKILIIVTHPLRDIVHGLQIVTSLKVQRHDLEVSWIVRDIFAPIVRASETVDHIYVFDRKGGVKGFLRLMKEVRKTKFDYVFDLQGMLRTGLITWQTRAARKIGRSDAREGSGVFYDEKVPLPPGGRNSHALDILLQFCPVLGSQPELRGQLRFREVDSLSLRHIEGRRGARPIVMFPDSRRMEKRWGGFKQLTELLIRDGRGPQNYLGRQSLPAGSRCLSRRPVFKSDRKYEFGIAACADSTGGLGDHQR